MHFNRHVFSGHRAAFLFHLLVFWVSLWPWAQKRSSPKRRLLVNRPRAHLMARYRPRSLKIMTWNTTILYCTSVVKRAALSSSRIAFLEGFWQDCTLVKDPNLRYVRNRPWIPFSISLKRIALSSCESLVWSIMIHWVRRRRGEHAFLICTNRLVDLSFVWAITYCLTWVLRVAHFMSIGEDPSWKPLAPFLREWIISSSDDAKMSNMLVCFVAIIPLEHFLHYLGTQSNNFSFICTKTRTQVSRWATTLVMVRRFRMMHHRSWLT